MKPETNRFSPAPWEYIPSTKNHGPYVVSVFGSSVCDCYTMSDPNYAAVCNGGTSHPINFSGEDANHNARLISAAPEMLEALRELLERPCDNPLSMTPEQRRSFFSSHDKARPAIIKATGDVANKNAPYGEWCRNPDLCAGKGYCPRDPTCGD